MTPNARREPYDGRAIIPRPTRPTRAPSPVSARAVYPHGIGRSLPALVSTNLPSISQTGKMYQPVSAMRSPRTSMPPPRA